MENYSKDQYVLAKIFLINVSLNPRSVASSAGATDSKRVCKPIRFFKS